METSTNVMHPLMPAYNGIVQFDPLDPDNVIGDLAEKWEVSADGKVYTFNFRKGANWHDGKPFSSDDAKFNLERMLDSKTRCPRGEYLTPIEKIETPNADTLRLTLKYPFNLLPLLAVGSMLMLPKHVIQAKGDMKKDVVGLLLDYLKLDRVHLIGETVGGTIAMQFAYEYPERLHSLTVCGSPFRFTAPVMLEFARQVEKDGLLPWARESMVRRLDSSQVDPAFVEWYANEMGKTSGQVMIEVLRALAGNDLSDILRQIKVPTLLLSAENRPGCPPGDAQEMQKMIPGSELVEFQGVTGFVQHSHPEKCLEVVLPFLEKHSGV